MSVAITARVFWTQFKDIEYLDDKSKTIKVGKAAAKLAMLAIADSADDFGENSWQSFETIAEKASIERRSVIRVVNGLIKHKYLTIKGTSKYGTNDYSIDLSKLGNVPTKRAKNGRPKTSDSDAKTSDSDAKTSDPESPYPSLSTLNPSLDELEMEKIKADANKKMDALISMSQYSGAKKQIRINSLESIIKVRTGLSPTSRWKDFLEFVDNRQQKDKQMLNTFIDWMISQPKFDIGFWGPVRMRENWERAFMQEKASAPTVEYIPDDTPMIARPDFSKKVEASA